MIDADDITDRLVKPIVTNDDSYFTRANLELVQLAAELVVDTDDIPTTLPHRVQEWLKNWVGWQVCIDNMGVSNTKLITENDIVDDPYMDKKKHYDKQAPLTRNSITAAVLKDEADTPGEFAYKSTKMHRAS